MKPWMLAAYLRDKTSEDDLGAAKTWNLVYFAHRMNRFRSEEDAVLAAPDLAQLLGTADMIDLRPRKRPNYVDDALDELNATLEHSHRAALAPPAPLVWIEFGEVHQWPFGVEVTVDPPTTVDLFGTPAVVCRVTVSNTTAAPLTRHMIVPSASQDGQRLDLLYTEDGFNQFGPAISPGEKLEFTLGFATTTTDGFEMTVTLVGWHPDALFRGTGVSTVATPVEEPSETESSDLALIQTLAYLAPVRADAIRDVIGRPSSRWFIVVADQDGQPLVSDAAGFVRPSFFAVANFGDELRWAAGDPPLQKYLATDLFEIASFVEDIKGGGPRIVP